MLNLRHRFVFVSKDDSFDFPKDKADAAAATEPNVSFEYVPGNSRPLAEVYNPYLDAAADDWTYFVHADVTLDFAALAAHVESVAGRYDVVGLCGCAKFRVTRSPLNWFTGSQDFPRDRWGCVTHGELGNATSFFSQDREKTTDHEVACVDGLCIGVSKAAAQKGIRFDPTLGAFDLYDTDFSLQAVLRYGLKVGVVVRKDLVHRSVGRSITTPAFLENEKKLRAKWGEELGLEGAKPDPVK